MMGLIKPQEQTFSNFEKRCKDMVRGLKMEYFDLKDNEEYFLKHLGKKNKKKNFKL